MGTSNFYNKNASKVYVVLEDGEERVHICKECGEEHFTDVIPIECESCQSTRFITEERTNSPEQYEIEEFKTYVREEAEKACTDKEIHFTKQDRYDDERNFTGHYLFTLSKSKEYAGAEVCVEVTAVLRSGYYEAANLDYEVKHTFQGYENDEPDYDDFAYHCETKDRKSINTGLAKVFAQRASDWKETALDELTAEIEKIFTVCSTPYNRVATASNGETFYEKV